MGTTDTVTTVNAENTRPELTRSLTAQFQEGLTDFLSHLGDQHGLETNEQPEPPESGQSLVAANSTESSSSTDVALTIQPKISVESITTATATPITTDDSKKKKKKRKNKEPLLLSSSRHSKKKTKTKKNKKESLLSSSHHRRRHRRSSETDEGGSTERRGR